jgi:hypothetical protein
MLNARSVHDDYLDKQNSARQTKILIQKHHLMNPNPNRE